MRRIAKSTLILICTVLPVSFLTLFSEPDAVTRISDAFKTGSSSELAKYFNPNVEMEILGEENMFSKAQAEILIKDFFNKNKPNAFKVNHQGSKAATSFAIGVLVTTNGSFRVSIFMKNESGKTFIHQLRIERADDNQP